MSIGGEPQPAPAPLPGSRGATIGGQDRCAGNGTRRSGDAAKAAGGAEAAPAEGPPPPPATAMERKVVNDAVAYIRGLAELRGRNADWAEQAVRGAASLSATAALQQKVIDVIAPDIPDLLSRIDGREVRLDERTVKLATRDLTITHMKPDWRTRAAGGDHQPHRGLRLDGDRHLGTAAGGIQPGRGAARAWWARSACWSRCSRSRSCR